MLYHLVVCWHTECVPYIRHSSYFLALMLASYIWGKHCQTWKSFENVLYFVFPVKGILIWNITFYWINNVVFCICRLCSCMLIWKVLSYDIMNLSGILMLTILLIFSCQLLSVILQVGTKIVVYIVIVFGIIYVLQFHVNR